MVTNYCYIQSLEVDLTELSPTAISQYCSTTSQQLMLTLVMSQRLSMAVFYSLQRIVREQTISYLQMVLQSKDIIIASV